MKRMITLLATAGCLLLMLASCTEKSGYNRGVALVDKIESIYGDTTSQIYTIASITYSYYPDGTIQSATSIKTNSDVDYNFFSKRVSRYSDTVQYLLEKKGADLHISRIESKWTAYDYNNFKNPDHKITDDQYILNLNEQGLFSNMRNKYGRECQLSYDKNNYLQKIAVNNTPVLTMPWNEGNMALSDYSYTPQNRRSNIDWDYFLDNVYLFIYKRASDELSSFPFYSDNTLMKILSASSYLGARNKDLPMASHNIFWEKCPIDYTFDDAGRVSSIQRTSPEGKITATHSISYLN